MYKPDGVMRNTYLGKGRVLRCVCVIPEHSGGFQVLLYVIHLLFLSACKYPELRAYDVSILYYDKIRFTEILCGHTLPPIKRVSRMVSIDAEQNVILYFQSPFSWACGRRIYWTS